MAKIINFLAVISAFYFSCTTKYIAALETTVDTNNKVAQIPHHPLTVDKDLDKLIDAIGNARIVLLGEDSHGTSEYYTWRAAISKKLIEEKNFNTVALEADWTDTYRLNQLFDGTTKDSGKVVSLLNMYDRWPQWLWANKEFGRFIRWIANYSSNSKNSVKIYGLDVYSFEEALDSLIAGLDDINTKNIAVNVKQCLKNYKNDAMAYQRAVQNHSANCGDAVNRLRLSITNLYTSGKSNNEQKFLMEQFANVVFNGERYFRLAARNFLGAWNIRDGHMAETVSRLLEHHGSTSKIIIWAHNTHIGDARFTDMPGRGRSNIGEMLRTKYNNNVFIVGFGSYEGSIIAAQKWDLAYEVMKVAAARAGSVEEVLHADKPVNKMIIMKEVENNPLFAKWSMQRAIGVLANPGHGLAGSYVPSLIKKRYDAFVFFTKTNPLRPLR